MTDQLTEVDMLSTEGLTNAAKPQEIDVSYDQAERQYNINQVATAMGQAQAGAGLGRLVGGDALPARNQRFDGPATHLEEMTKGLAELNGRLARVADRLGGTVPEPVEKDADRVSISCVAGRYERIADTYSAQIRKLFNTIERLEQL